MDVMVALSLPRDAATIPVVRGIAVAATGALGVTPECVADLSLAITEACSNVVRHAEVGAVYEVAVRVSGPLVEITVDDHGTGAATLPEDVEVEEMAEHGRGIHLMGELVDSLRFDVRTEGTTVRMTKSLEFLPGAPGAPAAVSG